MGFFVLGFGLFSQTEAILLFCDSCNFSALVALAQGAPTADALKPHMQKKLVYRQDQGQELKKWNPYSSTLYYLHEVSWSRENVG